MDKLKKNLTAIVATGIIFFTGFFYWPVNLLYGAILGFVIVKRFSKGWVLLLLPFFPSVTKMMVPYRNIVVELILYSVFLGALIAAFDLLITIRVKQTWQVKKLKPA